MFFDGGLLGIGNVRFRREGGISKCDRTYQRNPPPAFVWTILLETDPLSGGSHSRYRSLEHSTILFQEEREAPRNSLFLSWDCARVYSMAHDRHASRNRWLR